MNEGIITKQSKMDRKREEKMENDTETLQKQIMLAEIELKKQHKKLLEAQTSHEIALTISVELNNSKC